MKIDRVILSSNNNRDYLEFWDVVSEAWNVHVGIRPTLFVISEKEINLSNKNGDIYYQNPHETIPTAQQAQIIRFFGATLFPEEMCLISDLDMLPLQDGYFNDPVKSVGKDNILFYSADAYLPNDPAYPAFPMCYMCASGKTFKEILSTDINDFLNDVPLWMKDSYGWYTDEKVFFKKWWNWKEKDQRSVFLRRGFNRGPAITMGRIDRSESSSYDNSMLLSGRYIDYHMPRPFSENRGKIMEIYEKAQRGSYGP